MAHMAKSSKADSGFVQLVEEARKYRDITRIAGGVGTGKTYFGLTGPEPVFVQSVDKGLEAVVEQFVAAGKEIHVAEYDWRVKRGEEELSQDDATEIRDKIIHDYYYALDNGARTVVWDKESDIWQVFRYAEFGGPNDAPKNYEQLNARYKSLIDDAKACAVNFFLIQAMRDDWGLTGSVSAKTGKKSFGKIGT